MNVIPTNSKTLHQQFVLLGQEHKALVNKMASLLPEIYYSGIYKKYAENIYEYGRKYAGLSSGVVSKILFTFKKIENRPALKEAVIDAGIHKVALVATIATPQNELFLAEKVRSMSKAAVVELAKEIRGQKKKTLKLELDSEMQFLFKKLKKESGRENIADEEFLKELLIKLADLPVEGVNVQSKKRNIKKVKFSPGDGNFKKQSRHIPVAVKRLVVQNTRGKCAFPDCAKVYEQIHHTVPYSYLPRHIPEYLQPLCKTHHELVHNGIKPNLTSRTPFTRAGP